MTTHFHRVCALLAVLVTTAVWPDAIYRCQSGGRVSFSDVPCPAGPRIPPSAATAALPPLMSMTPTSKGEQTLANQFDAAASRAAVQQRVENEQWEERYQDNKKRAADIRKGLDKGYVVVGMTKRQVERVLNLPARIDDEGGPRERWIYQEGKRKRTITFENGLVVSDGSHSRKSG
jgi:hypothetical protein